MRLGFAVPVSGSWATREHLVEIAGRAEALGYDSLWTFQRLLSPVDDQGGYLLAPPYRAVDDPLAVLAFLAGRTDRVRLGVAVVNAPYFAPVLLAKMLATIDRLSDGRLDAGLGIGWMPEEFDAVGAPRALRAGRTEDAIAFLKTAWRDEVVTHEGPHYRVAPCRIDPKPLQRPHPPLLLGGAVDAALRRAGRIADGWVSASRADPRTLGRSIAVVREAAVAAGRDPDTLRFVCRAVVRVRDDERAPLVGTLDEVRADLAGLADQGVTEAFVDCNFDPRIAGTDVDPDEAMDRAREVLEGLAPGGRPRP